MAKNKIHIIQSVKKFFREFKSEIKKIVWPTPREAFKNTGVVLAVIIIIGIFVFILDTGLMNLLSLFMAVSK